MGPEPEPEPTPRPTESPDPACPWEAQVTACVSQGGMFECQRCADGVTSEPCCSKESLLVDRSLYTCPSGEHQGHQSRLSLGNPCCRHEPSTVLTRRALR